MYTCVCCGFQTKHEDFIWTYEICPVCWREDDYAQWKNPLLKWWANHQSLYETQTNFIHSNYEECKQIKEYKKSPDWKPLSQEDIARDNSQNIKNWTDYFNEFQGS